MSKASVTPDQYCIEKNVKKKSFLGHDWNELANDAAIAMDFPELQTTGSNSEVRRLLLSILSLKNTF